MQSSGGPRFLYLEIQMQLPVEGRSRCLLDVAFPAKLTMQPGLPPF